MKFNFKLINKAMKLLKPISKLYNIIKAAFPSKKNNNDDIYKEIESLKKDLKKHEKKIQELTEEKIKKVQKEKDVSKWIQAEMYVSVVVSGRKGGSESGGYILLNLPFDEFEKVKDIFFNMPTQTIKDKLGLPVNKILKNVSKGQALSNIQEKFIEINGVRKDYTIEGLK